MEDSDLSILQGNAFAQHRPADQSCGVQSEVDIGRFPGSGDRYGDRVIKIRRVIIPLRDVGLLRTARAGRHAVSAIGKHQFIPSLGARVVSPQPLPGVVVLRVNMQVCDRRHPILLIHVSGNRARCCEIEDDIGDIVRSYHDGIRILLICIAIKFPGTKLIGAGRCDHDKFTIVLNVRVPQPVTGALLDDGDIASRQTIGVGIVDMAGHHEPLLHGERCVCKNFPDGNSNILILSGGPVPLSPKVFPFYLRPIGTASPQRDLVGPIVKRIPLS